MDTPERLLKDYRTRVKATEKALTSLERRANEFRDLAEKRDAIEARIKECEMQVSACIGTREALFNEHQQAQFQEDNEQIQIIREQRRVLDEEVRELQGEIEQAEQELSGTEIDGKDLADFMARRDSLRLPSFTDLLDDIKDALQREKDELRAQVKSLSTGTMYGHDEQHYRDMREQLDPLYAAQQSRERLYAKQDAERNEQLRRLGTGNNTDEMESNRGARKRVDDPEMVVTAAGEPVGRYSLSDD